MVGAGVAILTVVLLIIVTRLVAGCRAKPLGSVLRPRVTLVGNGPISEKDRLQIASSECVVRFNDCKNLRPGEPTHLLVLRDHLDATPPIARDVPVWVVLSRKKKPMWLKHAKFVRVRPSVVVFERGQQSGAIHSARCKRLFPECQVSQPHAITPLGPSTGGAVIDALQSNPFVQRIDIFGMNWSGQAEHVDFLHSDIVSRCCTKCHVHVTATSEYI